VSIAAVQGVISSVLTMVALASRNGTFHVIRSDCCMFSQSCLGSTFAVLVEKFQKPDMGLDLD